jgi:hypothetical protein
LLTRWSRTSLPLFELANAIERANSKRCAAPVPAIAWADSHWTLLEEQQLLIRCCSSSSHLSAETLR